MIKFIKNLFNGKDKYKDFNKFLEKATAKDIDKYIKSLGDTDGRIIDYTKSHWGHTFNHEKKAGEFAHYGHGFYGSVLGSKKLKEGDFLLMKTASNKVCKYLILKIDYVNDPSDMYWAYIIGIEYQS